MAEAYWNFGIFGVVAIFLAFGAFHKRITQWLLLAPSDPLRRALYVAALLVLQEPSSEQFVPMAQITIVLVAVAYFGVRRVKDRVDSTRQGRLVTRK